MHWYGTVSSNFINKLTVFSGEWSYIELALSSPNKYDWSSVIHFVEQVRFCVVYFCRRGCRSQCLRQLGRVCRRNRWTASSNSVFSISTTGQMSSRSTLLSDSCSRCVITSTAISTLSYDRCCSAISSLLCLVKIYLSELWDLTLSLAVWIIICNRQLKVLISGRQSKLCSVKTLQ